MPSIFISYRRDDSAYVAEMVRARLAAQFGEGSVFMDVDNLPLGQDFRTHITEAVYRCDALVAIIGERWYGQLPGRRRIDDPQDFVAIELAAALSRGIPVVPVLVGRAEVPKPEDLPEPLKPLAFRNAVEVRPGSALRHQVDLLSRRLAAALRPESTFRPQLSRRKLLLVSALLIFLVSALVWFTLPCIRPFDYRPIGCLGETR